MSGPATITPASLTSATATKNANAMPAPQPQATVIAAIHSASTAAMITPHPDTTLGSVSFAGAFRQSNRTRSKRREKAMPTRLSLRIVDAGLPPEVAGRVAECGKCDVCQRVRATREATAHSRESGPTE
jgi:hypothetical protein